MMRGRETVNRETGNAKNIKHQEAAHLSNLDNQGAVLNRVHKSTFKSFLAKQW